MKIALLGLLEEVFELSVTITKHVLNLFNKDFMMLGITLFFATPAKLLHLLVPSEYDSSKQFTNTKSSFYAKSDWLYVPKWYLDHILHVLGENSEWLLHFSTSAYSDILDMPALMKIHLKSY